jgi:hypothetical protein
VAAADLPLPKSSDVARITGSMARLVCRTGFWRSRGSRLSTIVRWKWKWQYWLKKWIAFYIVEISGSSKALGS